MGLFSTTLKERNHEAIDRTRTINADKVGNFYSNGNSQTIFYYVEDDDRRKKAIRYISDDDFSTFKTSVANNSTTDLRVDLTVKTVGVNETKWEETVNIDKRRINQVWAVPDETSRWYVEFDNGAFETLRYKTSTDITA